MWGGLGCLILILIVVGLAGYGFYKFKTSKTGSAVLGSMGSVMSSAQNMTASATQARTVVTSLQKYKADNGSYPAQLTDLIPKYLPDTTSLHQPSDPVTDPSHDSYIYKKPSASAAPTDPLISYHSVMTVNMGTGSDILYTKATIAINGQTSEDQEQDITGPDGKVIKSRTHIDLPQTATPTQ